MVAVWLGENSVPTLHEMSSGVIEFRLYRDTSIRTRLVWFALLAGFASCVAGPGIVLSFGEWYPFGLILGFYFAWCTLAFFAIFLSSVICVDSRQRTLTRYRFLGDWQIQASVWKLTDEDEFTVYLSIDPNETGADHRVYLYSNGVDRHICNVHLPDVTPSNELMEWLDELAGRLQVRNTGYGSQRTFLKRWMTPRL